MHDPAPDRRRRMYKEIKCTSIADARAAAEMRAIACFSLLRARGFVKVLCIILYTRTNKTSVRHSARRLHILCIQVGSPIAHAIMHSLLQRPVRLHAINAPQVFALRLGSICIMAVAAAATAMMLYLARTQSCPLIEPYKRC